MDELLNFLQHTYKKYAGMERDKKSIVLEISRDDLQALIESVKQMDEIQVWKEKVFSLQDEIDRLKTEHLEEMKKLQNEHSTTEALKMLLRDELKVTECEFKGYRQAVKDILGGEG